MSDAAEVLVSLPAKEWRFHAVAVLSLLVLGPLAWVHLLSTRSEAVAVDDLLVRRLAPDGSFGTIESLLSDLSRPISAGLFEADTNCRFFDRRGADSPRPLRKSPTAEEAAVCLQLEALRNLVSMPDDSGTSPTTSHVIRYRSRGDRASIVGFPASDRSLARSVRALVRHIDSDSQACKGTASAIRGPDFSSTLMVFRVCSSFGDDVRVAIQTPNPSAPSPLGLFILNLVLAGSTFLAMLRITRPTRSSAFNLLVVISLAMLALSYAVLTTAALAVLFSAAPDSALGSAEVAASFLPSGAFLVSAGIALERRLRRRQLVLLISCLVPLELLAAYSDLATKKVIFAPLVACAALAGFGLLVYQHGKRFAVKQPSLAASHPGRLALYMGAAFVLWGLAQLLRLRVPSLAAPVLHLLEKIVDRSWWAGAAEGAFFVLLYAKAVALVLLLFHASAVKNIKTSRRARDIVITLDEQGRIARTSLGPQTPELRSDTALRSLFAYGEDADEITLALSQGRSLERLLVFLRDPLPPGLYAASLTNGEEPLIELAHIDALLYTKRLIELLTAEIRGVPAATSVAASGEQGGLGSWTTRVLAELAVLEDLGKESRPTMRLGDLVQVVREGLAVDCSMLAGPDDLLMRMTPGVLRALSTLTFQHYSPANGSVSLACVEQEGVVELRIPLSADRTGQQSGWRAGLFGSNGETAGRQLAFAQYLCRAFDAKIIERSTATGACLVIAVKYYRSGRGKE